ncbi:hypothetical protein EC988_003107 [Linderina pennispora]|nr:hypothetical protein EC988_003107 [Linderina pennispora]
MAIEHYLATKKGLMVDSSPQDRARQDELRNQILDIFLFAPQYRFATEEARKTIKEQYVTQAKFFIDFHENHLKNNGSNGYYFGSKITYVDIALVATMRALRRFGDESMPGMTGYLSPERAPLINKVLDVVGNDPKLAKFFSEPRVKPAVL